MPAREDYRRFIAEALRTNAAALANDWLCQLSKFIPEDRRDIFPTDLYLDHVPQMIAEIGNVLENSDSESAVDNTLISSKARELGVLRHQQNASVLQILHEYEALVGTLERFIEDQSSRFSQPIAFESGFEVTSFVGQMVRGILNVTTTVFIELYDQRIAEQTERIKAYNLFVSHELKTPLQSAILNVGILQMTPDLDSQHTQGLDNIEMAIDQMSALLSNLEALMYYETPRIASPELIEVELPALVETVVTRHLDALERARISLDAEGVTGTALADPVCLELILDNLVSNAIKYHDRNRSERALCIGSTRGTDPDVVSITVNDNGIGIAEADLDSIFDLRYRATVNREGNSAPPGQGLGLFLAREAAQAMNGSLQVASSLGEYTCFTICLPGEFPR